MVDTGNYGNYLMEENSVPDLHPDPLEQCVFWPPGSASVFVSYKYGSGFGPDPSLFSIKFYANRNNGCKILILQQKFSCYTFNFSPQTYFFRNLRDYMMKSGVAIFWLSQL